MTTYTVSCNNGNLSIKKGNSINSTQYPNVFKTEDDGVTEITFDEHFWKKCFYGDSIKDGATISILNGFLKDDFSSADRITGDEIKALSSQMTYNLEENNLIFKAEITRFKHYKTGLLSNKKLETQFSTAFPEGYHIYVDKDCGLDPEYFLPNVFNSCNVASKIIDPHSSKEATCDKMFPEVGDTLVLDNSVFSYLQYPCECSLRATSAKQDFTDINFIVDNFDLAPNRIKYFAGNKEKKENFSNSGSAAAKKENMRLCVAKYSGDTLQSFIHRLYELKNKDNIIKNTYIISTCDSIVSLRSYALNGSFIEVCKDTEKEKITQVFVWRPELNDTETLMNIFNAEKEKILTEYADFIYLVDGIEPTDIRNIFMAGTNTIYKFNKTFYEMIMADLRIISDAIYHYELEMEMEMNSSISYIAGKIRILRTFKVNDFIKINGPMGNKYCISLAKKYTKGDLNILEIEGHLSLGPLSSLKKPSRSFFEYAVSAYNIIPGGSPTKNMSSFPCNMDDIIEVFKTFFDINFYKYNPCLIYDNKNYDLHGQFISDFFDQIKMVLPKGFQNTLVYFDCFSDIINSFALLDIEGHHNKYYSVSSIRILIKKYYKELRDNLEKIRRDNLEKIRRDHLYDRSRARKKKYKQI